MKPENQHLLAGLLGGAICSAVILMPVVMSPAPPTTAPAPPTRADGKVPRNLIAASGPAPATPAPPLPAPPRRPSLRPLYDALRAVETGGHPNPAYAVGRAGERGWYQITAPYYQDAWGQLPANWANRVADQAHAEQTLLHYWQRYAPKALGEELDYEVLARVHNGGPDGHNKPATEPYWQRVKETLEAK